MIGQVLNLCNFMRSYRLLPFCVTPRAGESRVTGPRSEQSPLPPPLPTIFTLFVTKFFYVHIIFKSGLY